MTSSARGQCVPSLADVMALFQTVFVMVLVERAVHER
jgi:hypothetical protein